jgi:hypothetical protein
MGRWLMASRVWNRDISAAVPVQIVAQASHPSLSGVMFDRQ